MEMKFLGWIGFVVENDSVLAYYVECDGWYR